MVLWRKRLENFKEGNAIKHISLKTLKRVLWLLFLYKIVVFPSCFDIRRNLIYMLYLEWYNAKYIEKSRSFQNQCVFPLFSEKKKKHLQKICKCLIIKVDQLGLEPRTSRLWGSKFHPIKLQYVNVLIISLEVYQSTISQQLNLRYKVKY